MEIIVALLLGLGVFAASAIGGSDEDDALDDSVPADASGETTIQPITTLTDFGTDGDDVETLSDGRDTYDGGLGNDSIDGAGGYDSLSGGLGDDTLSGGIGFDTLDGGAGEDSLSGGMGQDLINGGSGSDSISGGGWNDTIYGGGGFDDIDGGSSNDTLYGGYGQDLLIGGTGNDDLNGDGWNDGLFGGEGNDTLAGGHSEDILSGGAGNDRLFGDGGDDLLVGDAGTDLLRGGAGDDILVGSDLMSRELTPDDYIAARAETLPLDEDGDPIIAGWSLTGSDAGLDVDTLEGGDGNDTLIIGNNDIATGGAGADDFILGDWIQDGEPAQILDFNTTEDIIVVQIEDSNSSATITTRIENGVGLVLIDDIVIATVQGSFDALDGLDADVVQATYAAA